MTSSRLLVSILPQPDDATCGPTCLHAVYAYHGDDVPLAQVVEQVPQLPTGGTLAVHLAHHALERGFHARIYTYNLQVFDPTWFELEPSAMRERLVRQRDATPDAKLAAASNAYIRFLDLGGELRLEDLAPSLIRAHLRRGVPLLTGLSATFLYRAMRERDGEIDDDVRGTPTGHFVVLCGHDGERRSVLVADPLMPNPVSSSQVYEIGIERVLGAILLGIVTYDANLLAIEPTAARRRKR